MNTNQPSPLSPPTIDNTRLNWHSALYSLRIPAGTEPLPLVAINGQTHAHALSEFGVIFQGYAFQDDFFLVLDAYLSRLGYEIQSACISSEAVPEQVEGHYYQVEADMQYAVAVNVGPLSGRIEFQEGEPDMTYRPQVDRQLIPYVQALREQD